MFCSVEAATRTFDFFSDTFAFRNELVWEYLVDEQTGRVTTRRNDPPPTYAHRCFVVVRSAKQFFLHARFDPALPQVSNADYANLIRAIVRRHVARPSAEDDKIIFPGFANLRDFSRAHEALLKANCGGAWHSYINKRHWRMLFPFKPAHLAREADLLKQAIRAGQTPVVHVVRFPELTINHALLIYSFEESAEFITFITYDPNLPGGPSQLIFSKRTSLFELPRNIYWAGGRVNVYETYTGTKFSRPSLATLQTQTQRTTAHTH